MQDAAAAHRSGNRRYGEKLTHVDRLFIRRMKWLDLYNLLGIVRVDALSLAKPDDRRTRDPNLRQLL